MGLSTEFKVGLFTILGLATVGGTMLMIRGTTFLHKKNYYTSELSNAAGVSERTQVRVAGVQVGYVIKVLVEPDGAEIQFAVESDIKIPIDSHLEIKSRGMLGDVFVEIERGHSTQLFASGATIPAQGDAGDIQKLIANMNSIATDVKKITDTLFEAFNGEGENNLKSMITNLEKTAKNIADIVSQNETKISNVIDNIDKFTAQLGKLSTDENREKITNIIANLDVSIADLKQIANKIEHGEGTIGQLVEEDETVNEIKKTLANIQKTVSPFADLRIGLEDRFEYRFRNAETGSKVENQFNVLFWTKSTPSRYYLIGLVNSQYGRKVTQTKYAETDGTITRQRDYTEDTWLWKFNAQVSQRLAFMGADFLGVRVGFFRSTPGFAVDIYGPHNMFVLANEFYDFDGFPMATDDRYGARHVMNAKLYANIYLTPNVYLTAGVTRLILLDKPWPFFGAGVYFTDWDIQGLFAGSKNKTESPTTIQNTNTKKPNKSVTPKNNTAPTTNQTTPAPNESDNISTKIDNLSPMPQPEPYPPQPNPTPPPT